MATTDASVRLGNGNDVLRAGSALRATILGEAGSDYIKIGSVQDSTIITGANNDADDDIVEIGSGISNTTIRAGGGRDRLLLQGTFFDGIVNNPNAIDANGISYYQLGSNRFYGFESVEFLTPPPLKVVGGTTGTGGSSGGSSGGSGTGTNQPSIEAQTTQIPGGGIILRAALNSDSIQRLIGTNFDDVITGSSKADILRGKAGLDLLTGLGGSDRFQFNHAKIKEFISGDRIFDFTRGQDKIEIINVDKQSGLGKALMGKQPSKKSVVSVRTKNKPPRQMLFLPMHLKVESYFTMAIFQAQVSVLTGA